MYLNLKHIFLFSLYTLIFSALVFVGKNIFFPSDGREESYVEPSISSDFVEFDDQKNHYVFTENIEHPDEEVVAESAPADSETYEEIYQKFYENFISSKRDHIRFSYIPEAFSGSIIDSYIPLSEMFLYEDDIVKSIRDLGVYYYQNKADVRGRMKSEHIHMFGVESLPQEEFLSVLIHEFGHYFDIYSLARTSFGDESDNFYAYSWESPTVMKGSLTPADFVSGYAMTNQYEDFAESYTYYILHNKDFLARAESSEILSKKYSFFRDTVFRKNQFYKENFSTEPVQSYYWDVTKIDFDLKKFLQYLENSL